MKKIVLFVLLAFLTSTLVTAQPWMAKVPPNSPRNFYTIKKAFDNYWQDKNPEKVNGNNEGTEEEETTGDGSYLQFERWANFMEPRVFPSGNFFDPVILQKEFEKYNNRISSRSTETNSAAWTFIGPAVVPGNGGGAGRVDCIALSPKDTATIFVGAASGGLWVTHNSGQTWATTTDLLPALSIADIAINPNNTDTMYVATGDGYGYTVPEGNEQVFWGGTYSAGVMKSVDGGLTWNTTGLTHTQDSMDVINRLLIDPNNPNILLAATHTGTYRTINAGITWIRVDTGTVFDLAFNTANSDTVYAAHSLDIFKSNDAGATWYNITNGSLYNEPSDRITLATTPANSNVIYVINYSDEYPVSLFRSSDGGNTFSSQTYPFMAQFYGYYDLVMAVSPTDANTLYCGGYEIVQSTDGGNSWNYADNVSYPSPDYVHVDKHAIIFYPNSNSDILCGNDGGLFRTTNGGNTWTDLSNGLAIKQYYRISSSALNVNYIYAGAQDNGTDRYNGFSWQQVTGADGMQPLVDYTSDDINYTSAEYGYLSKSINGGNSFNVITPNSSGNGSWTTPYILNPQHHKTILAGYSYVYRSYDEGYTWTGLSSLNNTGDEITSMAISVTDTNYIYAGFYGDLISTTDGGNTWTDITGTLPVNQNALTWIAVSSYDPQKIWVTFSGYTDGSKIFESKDGGNTWINYSGSLPNIPANCVAYQPKSKDVLYVGTDLGVFVRDSTMSDWELYNTGLPNVIINQLEVVPLAGQLRAATYGRGIWETGLYDWTSGIAPVSSEDDISVYPNPSNGLFTLSVSSTQQDNISIDVINVLGEIVMQAQKQVQSGPNGFELNLSQQAKGVYFIRISSSNESVIKKVILTD